MQNKVFHWWGPALPVTTVRRHLIGRDGGGGQGQRESEKDRGAAQKATGEWRRLLELLNQ